MSFRCYERAHSNDHIPQMKFFSSHKRPVHLGPFPLERLPRDAHPVPAGLTPACTNPSRPTPTGFAGIVRTYLDAFLACDEIPVASERVPRLTILGK